MECDKGSNKPLLSHPVPPLPAPPPPPPHLLFGNAIRNYSSQPVQNVGTQNKFSSVGNGQGMSSNRTSSVFMSQQMNAGCMMGINSNQCGTPGLAVGNKMSGQGYPCCAGSSSNTVTYKTFVYQQRIENPGHPVGFCSTISNHPSAWKPRNCWSKNVNTSNTQHMSEHAKAYYQTLQQMSMQGMIPSVHHSPDTKSCHFQVAFQQGVSPVNAQTPCNQHLMTSQSVGPRVSNCYNQGKTSDICHEAASKQAFTSKHEHVGDDIVTNQTVGIPLNVCLEKGCFNNLKASTQAKPVINHTEFSEKLNATAGHQQKIFVISTQNNVSQGSKPVKPCSRKFCDNEKSSEQKSQAQSLKRAQASHQAQVTSLSSEQEKLIIKTFIENTTQQLGCDDNVKQKFKSGEGTKLQSYLQCQNVTKVQNKESQKKTQEVLQSSQQSLNNIRAVSGNSCEAKKRNSKSEKAKSHQTQDAARTRNEDRTEPRSIKTNKVKVADLIKQILVIQRKKAIVVEKGNSSVVASGAGCSSDSGVENITPTGLLVNKSADTNKEGNCNVTNVNVMDLTKANIKENSNLTKGTLANESTRAKTHKHEKVTKGTLSIGPTKTIIVGKIQGLSKSGNSLLSKRIIDLTSENLVTDDSIRTSLLEKPRDKTVTLTENQRTTVTEKSCTKKETLTESPKTTVVEKSCTKQKVPLTEIARTTVAEKLCTKRNTPLTESPRTTVVDKFCSRKETPLTDSHRITVVEKSGAEMGKSRTTIVEKSGAETGKSRTTIVEKSGAETGKSRTTVGEKSCTKIEMMSENAKTSVVEKSRTATGMLLTESPRTTVVEKPCSRKETPLTDSRKTTVVEKSGAETGKSRTTVGEKSGAETGKSRTTVGEKSGAEIGKSKTTIGEKSCTKIETMTENAKTSVVEKSRNTTGLLLTESPRTTVVEKSCTKQKMPLTEIPRTAVVEKLCTKRNTLLTESQRTTVVEKSSSRKETPLTDSNRNTIVEKSGAETGKSRTTVVEKSCTKKEKMTENAKTSVVEKPRTTTGLLLPESPRTTVVEKCTKQKMPLTEITKTTVVEKLCPKKNTPLTESPRTALVEKACSRKETPLTDSHKITVVKKSGAETGKSRTTIVEKSGAETGKSRTTVGEKSCTKIETMTENAKTSVVEKTRTTTGLLLTESPRTTVVEKCTKQKMPLTEITRTTVVEKLCPKKNTPSTESPRTTVMEKSCSRKETPLTDSHKTTVVEKSDAETGKSRTTIVEKSCTKKEKMTENAKTSVVEKSGTRTGILLTESPRTTIVEKSCLRKETSLIDGHRTTVVEKSGSETGKSRTTLFEKSCTKKEKMTENAKTSVVEKTRTTTGLLLTESPRTTVVEKCTKQKMPLTEITKTTVVETLCPKKNTPLTESPRTTVVEKSRSRKETPFTDSHRDTTVEKSGAETGKSRTTVGKSYTKKESVTENAKTSVVEKSGTRTGILLTERPKTTLVEKCTKKGIALTESPRTTLVERSCSRKEPPLTNSQWTTVVEKSDAEMGKSWTESPKTNVFAKLCTKKETLTGNARISVVEKSGPKTGNALTESPRTTVVKNSCKKKGNALTEIPRTSVVEKSGTKRGLLLTERPRTSVVKKSGAKKGKSWSKTKSIVVQLKNINLTDNILMTSDNSRTTVMAKSCAEKGTSLTESPRTTVVETSVADEGTPLTDSQGTTVVENLNVIKGSPLIKNLRTNDVEKLSAKKGTSLTENPRTTVVEKSSAKTEMSATESPRTTVTEKLFTEKETPLTESPRTSVVEKTVVEKSCPKKETPLNEIPRTTVIEKPGAGTDINLNSTTLGPMKPQTDVATLGTVLATGSGTADREKAIPGQRKTIQDLGTNSAKQKKVIESTGTCNQKKSPPIESTGTCNLKKSPPVELTNVIKGTKMKESTKTCNLAFGEKCISREKFCSSVSVKTKEEVKSGSCVSKNNKNNPSIAKPSTCDVDHSVLKDSMTSDVSEVHIQMSVKSNANQTDLDTINMSTNCIDTGYIPSTERINTGNIKPTECIDTGNIKPMELVDKGNILSTELNNTGNIMSTEHIDTDNTLSTELVDTGNIKPTKVVDMAHNAIKSTENEKDKNLEGCALSMKSLCETSPKMPDYNQQTLNQELSREGNIKKDFLPENVVTVARKHFRCDRSIFEKFQQSTLCLQETARTSKLNPLPKSITDPLGLTVPLQPLQSHLTKNSDLVKDKLPDEKNGKLETTSANQKLGAVNCRKKDDDITFEKMTDFDTVRSSSDVLEVENENRKNGKRRCKSKDSQSMSFSVADTITVLQTASVPETEHKQDSEMNEDKFINDKTTCDISRHELQESSKRNNIKQNLKKISIQEDLTLEAESVEGLCTRFDVDEKPYHPIALPLGCHVCSDSDSEEGTVSNEEEAMRLGKLMAKMGQDKYELYLGQSTTYRPWILYPIDMDHPSLRKECDDVEVSDIRNKDQCRVGISDKTILFGNVSRENKASFVNENSSDPRLQTVRTSKKTDFQDKNVQSVKQIQNKRIQNVDDHYVDELKPTTGQMKGISGAGENKTEISKVEIIDQVGVNRGNEMSENCQLVKPEEQKTNDTTSKRPEADCYTENVSDQMPVLTKVVISDSSTNVEQNNDTENSRIMKRRPTCKQIIDGKMNRGEGVVDNWKSLDQLVHETSNPLARIANLLSKKLQSTKMKDAINPGSRIQERIVKIRSASSKKSLNNVSVCDESLSKENHQLTRSDTVSMTTRPVEMPCSVDKVFERKSACDTEVKDAADPEMPKLQRIPSTVSELKTDTVLDIITPQSTKAVEKNSTKELASTKKQEGVKKNMKNAHERLLMKESAQFLGDGFDPNGRRAKCKARRKHLSSYVSKPVQFSLKCKGKVVTKNVAEQNQDNLTPAKNVKKSCNMIATPNSGSIKRKLDEEKDSVQIGSENSMKDILSKVFQESGICTRNLKKKIRKEVFGTGANSEDSTADNSKQQVLKRVYHKKRGRPASTSKQTSQTKGNAFTLNDPICVTPLPRKLKDHKSKISGDCSKKSTGKRKTEKTVEPCNNKKTKLSQEGNVSSHIVKNISNTSVIKSDWKFGKTVTKLRAPNSGSPIKKTLLKNLKPLQAATGKQTQKCKKKPSLDKKNLPFSNVRVRLVTDREAQKGVKANRPVSCRYCKTMVPSKLTSVHVKKSHPFRCYTCHKLFSSKDEKQQHNSSVHNAEQTLYHCGTCERVFNSAVRMEIHCKSGTHQQHRSNLLKKINMITGPLKKITDHFTSRNYLAQASLQSTTQAILPVEESRNTNFNESLVQEPFVSFFTTEQDQKNVTKNIHHEEPELRRVVKELDMLMYKCLSCFPSADCMMPLEGNKGLVNMNQTTPALSQFYSNMITYTRAGSSIDWQGGMCCGNMPDIHCQPGNIAHHGVHSNSQSGIPIQNRDMISLHNSSTVNKLSQWPGQSCNMPNSSHSSFIDNRNSVVSDMDQQTDSWFSNAIEAIQNDPPLTLGNPVLSAFSYNDQGRSGTSTHVTTDNLFSDLGRTDLPSFGPVSSAVSSTSEMHFNNTPGVPVYTNLENISETDLSIMQGKTKNQIKNGAEQCPCKQKDADHMLINNKNLSDEHQCQTVLLNHSDQSGTLPEQNQGTCKNSPVGLETASECVLPENISDVLTAVEGLLALPRNFPDINNRVELSDSFMSPCQENLNDAKISTSFTKAIIPVPVVNNDADSEGSRNSNVVSPNDGSSLSESCNQSQNEKNRLVEEYERILSDIRLDQIESGDFQE